MQKTGFSNRLLIVCMVCFVSLGTGVSLAGSKTGDLSSVKIWEEKVVIPTYRLGPPDPNPMFYTHESYQGAQKRIYPYPFQDYLTHIREDQEYTALYLENEYVKLSILPEIGARLFSALDKTNNYDFFYRQHVIKPALIGMLGAWISGGVEWCAFHHHRNSTYMPIDYTLESHEDGSKTIWFGETERRHRMKWLIGITLHPGKSYLETTVKFFNRTPVPHSVLYWANVAVHVDETYQVIFPPSVQLTTYHSKIEFSRWPVGAGSFRGVDYNGVDLSWWKNHPEPVSFFAWDLKEDFMGGYDHGRQAGVVHIGDHNVVTGAKLWEWGTGPAGRMWDDILTDEDGPYAELMVGGFSDNQPDYSWVKPNEVKVFKQYWYPVRQIGGFKNANLEAAVNLELKADGKARVGFHPSSKHEKAKVILRAGSRTLLEQVVQISPEKPFVTEVQVPAGTVETDLRAALIGEDGKELVAYQPIRRDQPEMPQPVQAPPAPKDVKTVEELYLTGLRIEQIHNPNVDPFDYYNEALKRDPGDSRTNTIVGINLLRRGLYGQAEKHFRTAIERISAEYTRPGNTEAYYHLGVALKAQGKMEEAYKQFYRATWDYAFHSAGHYQMAELSLRNADFARAGEHARLSSSTNALDTKALNIQAISLRKQGKTEEALAVAAQALVMDPLDFLARNEMYLTRLAAQDDQKSSKDRGDLRRMMRDDVQSYLELAVDYMNSGLWDEAMEVLLRPVEQKMEYAGTYPLVYYYLGYLFEQKGDRSKAADYYRQASTMPSDYVFPFRLETAEVLKAALSVNPSDARAWYYLGNLFYEIQPEEAIAYWEKSRSLDDRFAMVHRNLGWAYYRTENQVGKAIESYETAVARNSKDHRLFLELDTLYELGNAAPEKRQAMLESNQQVVKDRKESLLRSIMALVVTGNYDRSIDYLTNNYFHVREGGGEIRDVYVDAHLLKGLQSLQGKKSSEAVRHFQLASEFPENLSVGRPRFDRRAPQINYYIGAGYEAAGQPEKASEFFRRASEQEGTSRWPEARFYQALSLRKLGDEQRAAAIFDGLIEAAARTLNEPDSTEFFTKFGEQETKQARTAAAHYNMGLGLLGKGETDKAKKEFEQAVKLNLSHVWAKHQASVLAAQAQ
jgi:tetratricopeptide (TPR) repeat protein